MPSPSSRTISVPSRLGALRSIGSLLPILASASCVWALAVFEEPPGSGEMLYLGVLGLAALVACAVWSPPDEAVTVGLLALAFGATLGLLPPGPTRIAVATAVLLGGGALVAGRRLAPGAAPPSWIAVGLGLVALRFAWRPLLLVPPPGIRETLTLILLPALAATALIALLVECRGRSRTLLAVVIAGLVGGGPTVTVTSVLGLVTGGEVLQRVQTGDLGKRWLGVGVVLLAAPWFSQPFLAAMGLVAAGATLAPPKAAPLVPAAVIVGLLALGTGSGAVDWSFLWTLPILLPLAFDRRSVPPATALTGLLLAATGLAVFPGSGGLALAMAWLALRLDPRAPGYRLQLGWNLGLVLIATLAASLPWGRTLPLSVALDLLGLGLDWPTGLGMIGATVLVVGALRQGWRTATFALVAVVVLLLAWGAWSLDRPPTQALPGTPLQLIADDPNRALEIPAHNVRALTVDSTLTHAAQLPYGTLVAYVELRGLEDELVDRLSIRVGSDTGDWTGLGPAPSAWQVVPSPDGQRLSLTYRSRRTWEEPIGIVTSVRLVRSPRLPTGVAWVVRNLEVTP